jgi:hypothetical protein
MQAEKPVERYERLPFAKSQEPKMLHQSIVKSALLQWCRRILPNPSKKRGEATKDFSRIP